MPTSKQWWIIGGVTLAVLVGGYAYAKSRPKPVKIPSPRTAVRKAIKMLPGEDSIEIADAAYVMAYPKCPPLLDPDDPTHEDCIAKWLELRDMALQELEPPQKTPPKEPKGDDPTAPEDLPGPAKDMREWLEDLTSEQRSGVWSIVGAQYMNPIETAAKAGDNSGTVSAVLRLKRSIEELVETDKMAAFKKYQELQALLGPKLEKLLRTAQKYSN